MGSEPGRHRGGEKYDGVHVIALGGKLIGKIRTGGVDRTHRRPRWVCGNECDHAQADDSAHLGKFMRRTRSWKRGSECRPSSSRQNLR